MSQYSQLIGSFLRTGNFPLEADYIFETEAALKEYFNDELNKTILHEGLLKIVKSDDEGKQSLYWVVNGEDGLEFKKLIKDLDVDNLQSQLDELLSKLNQEIQDRKDADTQLWGTEDTSTIDDSLNSILDLANAITEFKQESEEYHSNIKEELKAVVGTDQDDIITYIKTLDYPTLTDLSNRIHNFLDTTNTEDGNIDTWPELQSFLEGYKDTEKLYQILDEIVSSLDHDIANLQTEIDQTQVGVGLSGDGSYSADRETHYLQSATSVMNALKILDSLIYEALQEFIINPANKDIVPLEITKTENGYNIGASLMLSSQNGNQLSKRADGLYINGNLEYDDGQVTFKVNDNIVSQFNIGLSSILADGYYSSDTEEIVLIFNKIDSTQQTIRIPVGSLIREWEPDNANSNVTLNREEVINGTDKLSANVKISTQAHNILQDVNHELYVEGTTDAITYNEAPLTSTILDLQTRTTSLESNVSSIKVIQQEVPQTGYSATYYVAVNNVQVGSSINIPIGKNLETITIKEVTELNVPYQGAKVGDRYIEFAFENETKPLYLPIADLVIQYKAGNGIDISSENFISAKVFINDKYLENSTDGIKSKGIDDAINVAKQEVLEQLDSKAPIDSPILTGVPMVETSPDPEDSSQRIPSTNWVMARIAEAPFNSPESYWLILTEE